MFELNVGQFKEMVGMGEPDKNDSLPWLTYLRIAPEEYLELFNGVINPPNFARFPFMKMKRFNLLVWAAIIWRMP